MGSDAGPAILPCSVLCVQCPVTIRDKLCAQCCLSRELTSSMLEKTLSVGHKTGARQVKICCWIFEMALLLISDCPGFHDRALNHVQVIFIGLKSEQ